MLSRIYYKNFLIVAGMISGLFLFAGTSLVQAAEKIALLPQDLEIELALSALPPHLRDQATVYTLNPKRGFEIVREGTNGFHALVARTSSAVYEGTWSFSEYPDDLLIPIAFDRAGSKANMKPLFDIAKMQAEGVPSIEAQKMIRERYQSGVYKAPERVGVSYMLSPVLRAYMNPEKSNEVGTFNYPHYMFYAPNVSNQDIGGTDPSSPYPWAFRPGPHGYINLKVGEKEIAGINKEYRKMVSRVCAFKKAFCLPKPSPSQ
jgi:hypothetical protein